MPLFFEPHFGEPVEELLCAVADVDRMTLSFTPVGVVGDRRRAVKDADHRCRLGDNQSASEGAMR